MTLVCVCVCEEKKVQLLKQTLVCGFEWFCSAYVHFNMKVCM